MIERISKIAGMAFVFAATALPALAAPGCIDQVCPRTALPEPATMSLFGLGVGGAYIVKKFIKRK